MAGTQASRHRLYSELGELLSPEAMDEFMDVFPPVGWGEIARRQDITNLEYATRADMAELAGALRSEIAELRSETRSEIASVRTEMADLRSDMRTEFAAVRTEMAHLRGDMTAAMRTQLFAMIGAMFTLAGLTWAATSIT